MKVIGVTPAGRKKYLSVLAPCLLRQRHVLQEHRFWVNTTNEEDIAYIESLCQAHPDFFKAIYLTDEEPDGIHTIHRFFLDCCEQDALYIRLDDDICWIEESALSRLVEARLRYPEPFLVYANTINHPVCSHIHQNQGVISQEAGRASGDGLCDVGWRSGAFGELAHRSFLKALAEQDHRRFYFEDQIIPHGTNLRVAINCICWFGRDLAACQGKVGEKEEDWLSIQRPAETQRSLRIVGDALVAHFAYFPQRSHMDRSGVLEEYRRLSAL
jgi:hypothetical protein